MRKASELIRSLISQRRVAKSLKMRLKMAADPLVEDRVYIARSRLTRGLKRKGGYEFLPRLGRLTGEEGFLQKLDLTNLTIYDVGGGRGRFTLFFARAVGGNGKVVTYEPNPANYRCIGDQVKLNGFSNVRVRQVGLGATGGAASLVFRPSDPGRGSVSEVLTKSTLGHADAVTVPVELDSMDHQIAAFGQPVPDFVKIDVEGFEFEVLNGMTDTIERRRPALFVEIHGTDSQDKIRNARRVVHFLIARRYSLYHVESRGGIDATNAETAKEGHLYCEARAALGTPSDRARL